MASIWHITCWHCSWSSELLPSFPKTGPAHLLDASVVADFGSFAWSLAWLWQACIGSFWHHVRNPFVIMCSCWHLYNTETYHNTQSTTDIRTSQGSLITHSFDPFLAGHHPSYFSARISFLHLLLLYSSSSQKDKVLQIIFFPYFYISIPL